MTHLENIEIECIPRETFVDCVYLDNAIALTAEMISTNPPADSKNPCTILR